MIRWCRRCETQPLDSYDQIFGNGACVTCIAEGVGNAFDKAILFGGYHYPECFVPRPDPVERLHTMLVGINASVNKLLSEDHIIRSEN